MAEERSYWQGFWRKRLSRRKVLRGAALGGAGLAAAMVVGCAEEEKPKAPAATAAATPTPAAVQPKKGGTLIGYDTGEPPSFDTYLTWNYRTIMANSMTYPRLFKFKVFSGVVPAEFPVEPDLAKGAEQPDNLTHVFKLLPATWEDKAPVNGRKLTAQEVAFNWERFMKIHPNRLLFVDVDRVETPDEATVVFKLKAPVGPFVNHMAHPGMFWTYPRELIEQEKTKTQVVGAGAFLLDKYEVGSNVIYKRNPKYYRGPDLPYVDQVEYRVIPDLSTAVAALRTKQVDFNYWVGVSQIDERSLRPALPKAVFVEGGIIHDAMMTVDGANPLFLDERVRRALSMSLDREALLGPSGGKGGWATQTGTLPKWSLDPKDKAKFGENVQYYHRDLAEVKKLLDAAGVSAASLKGLPIHTTRVLAYATRGAESELGHAQFKEAGFEFALDFMETTAFYTVGITSANHEGLSWGARQTSADPNEMLSIVWLPGSPKAPARGALLQQIEGDAKLQDLLVKQKRELKAEERLKLIHELQRYMSGKMYSVPLVNPSYWHVHQEHVKDMWWNLSYGPGPEYVEKAWIDKA